MPKPTYKKALDLEAASKKPNPERPGPGQQLAWAKSMPAPARFPRPMPPMTRPPKSTRPAPPSTCRTKPSSSSRRKCRCPGRRRRRGHRRRSQPGRSSTTSRARGSIQKATDRSQDARIVLPPDCADAYQKYLALAPTGPYAAEVKGILDQAGQKINSNYKARQKVAFSLAWFSL